MCAGGEPGWTVYVQRALLLPRVVSVPPSPLRPRFLSRRLCGAIGIPADLARQQGGISNGRTYLKQTAPTIILS